MKRMDVQPPHYQSRPLDEQFDDGFGLIADAFQEAAEHLEKVDSEQSFLHSSLPICFLYRHAIELYLKSLIVVIHRSLKIPFDKKRDLNQPAIRKDNKWKSIYNVHSIKDLNVYFQKLVKSNLEKINSLCITDWSTMPNELSNWINVIDEVDKQSTYFRYPDSRDAIQAKRKSDFKSVTHGKISGVLDEGKYIKAFVEVDEKDKLVGFYMRDKGELEDLQSTLQQAANFLSAIHFGARCDLTKGY